MFWEDALVPLFRKLCIGEDNVGKIHLENSQKITVPLY